MLLDDDVLDLMKVFSELYARSKGKATFSTTPNEVQTFLRLLLATGYSSAPHQRLYWSLDEDVSNGAMASFMMRNHLTKLMRYLCVSDIA